MALQQESEAVQAIASCIDLLFHAMTDGSQARSIQAANTLHVKNTYTSSNIHQQDYEHPRLWQWHQVGEEFPSLYKQTQHYLTRLFVCRGEEIPSVYKQTPYHLAQLLMSTGPLALVPRQQLDNYRHCGPKAVAHST